MLHGDISNQSGYTIAFRCEDGLFKPKKGKFIELLQRIAPKLKGRFIADSLNPEYLKTMEYLYRNTNFTIDVVILEDNYSPYIKHILQDLPFNRVIKIRNESNITTRLNVGDISLYVDEDEYRLSLVNSQFAIPIRKLNTKIKRRV